MLTQEELKKQLSYDPVTGEFTRFSTGKKTGSPNKRGYLYIQLNGKHYRAHRLAWLYIYGEWPKDQIDHINHVIDDNRIENLRAVSRIENQRNRKRNKNNTSGYHGVHWCAAANKWAARIKTNGKVRHLGVFENKDDAIAIRKQAEKDNGFHPNHGAQV